MAIGLSACGFTPLYATQSSGGGVGAGLSAIAVNAPQGRTAFLLRQDLDDALAREPDVPAVWRLDITVSETRDPRGLSVSDVAQRYDLDLKVGYTLTAVATGKIATTGEVVTSVSYDAANAPYAGIAARQDSQARAASDAARRIQIRLAAWMAGHPGN